MRAGLFLGMTRSGHSTKENGGSSEPPFSTILPCEACQAARLRRLIKPSPARPRPKMARVAGSGMAENRKFGP